MKYLNKITLLFFTAITFISCNKDDINTTITSISPESGPKETIVSIQGDHFGVDMDKVSVYFNGKEAEVLTVSESTITATVPARAFSGLVKVIANGIESIGPKFTYVISEVNTSLIAGNGTPGYANGTGAVAQFNTPIGLTIDNQDNIFVSEYGNNRIRKITPTGAVTTIAGSGVVGVTDGTGIAAQFNRPWGITMDAQNNLYVADYGNHTIRKITSSGAVTTIAGVAGASGNTDGIGANAQFSFPAGIISDSQGKLYVTDSSNHRIRMIETSNGNVTTITGSIAGSTDGSTSDAQFNRPFGITIDGAGNLFIADTNNRTIRKITPSGTVTTLAGNSGSTGDIDGIGDNARFSTIFGIAIDANDNLYVPDNSNQKIKSITPSGLVTTLAGNTTAGYIEGSGTTAQFKSPYIIVVDSENNLIVADTYNHRIRKIVIE